MPSLLFSASVKAYFALKMIGDDVDAPHMARARAAIHAAGGAAAVNVFTRIQLALEIGAFGIGQERGLHDAVHKEAIREVGGDPARRRVRMKEISLLLQVAHGVADGGSRDAELEAARDRATPCRLRRIHIAADDSLQHATFPVAQFGANQPSFVHRIHLRRSRIAVRGVNP